MFDLIEGVQLEPIAILDIVLTAILIYGAFSLIQGTRAVRLIVGRDPPVPALRHGPGARPAPPVGIMQLGAVVGPLRPRRRLPA